MSRVSGNALRKMVADLKRDAAARGIASPGLLMFDVGEACPTPRFASACATIERKWPQALIVVIRGFGDAPDERNDRMRPPLEPAFAKPWTAAVTAAHDALAADVAEWRKSPGFRELLAAEVQRDIRDALRCRGAPSAIEQLRWDRERCERYGVRFPPEAQAILDGRHELQGPAAAQVLELPAWTHKDDGRTRTEPARLAPPACVQCGERHSTSVPACPACRCPVEHHDAWKDRRVCVWCTRAPQDHVHEAAGCGSYRGYVVANADRCRCGRCSGLVLVVARPLALPSPEQPQEGAPSR